MKAENRLKLAEVCTRFYAKGSDEQVKLFTFYVELGIKALQELEIKNKKLKETEKPKETKAKPKKEEDKKKEE